MAIYSVITGSGSYVPPKRVDNTDFLDNTFFDLEGQRIETPNEQIVEKFKEITTIGSRMYVADDQVCSDLAHQAAKNAIEDAQIDPETLDYIIVAQNFGDTKKGSTHKDILPSLASRVKQKLGIKNPFSVAYDVIFGCPGWVQAVIQADYYIKSGDAKRILVIGADVLSRVSDPHDRDSMIYADGAGAIVLEAHQSDTPIGILGHNSRSDALEYAHLLYMGYSNDPEEAKSKQLYLKMYGRKLYQYALENVPTTLKSGLDKLQIPIEEVKKVLLHQANGKMDDAILKRFYRLYKIREIPEDVMPMTISWLGNSSVATVPTLLDHVLKKQIPNQTINPNDVIILASVGAGMNINSIVYKMP